LVPFCKVLPMTAVVLAAASSNAWLGLISKKQLVRMRKNHWATGITTFCTAFRLLFEIYVALVYMS
jgi:hypothetical protein